MEKKGTRIAYFIALAIVVIALVIAKVANDGSGFVATGWALFPPIVAIALALISKEVYSSLFWAAWWVPCCWPTSSLADGREFHRRR
ncbi:MAG: hypothetical protein ACLTGT_07290 [Oscillospiraceae bacterium]